MQYIKSMLIDQYLNYWNEYLTHQKWADDNDMNIEDADIILGLGKKYHKEHSEFIEGLKK